MRLSLLLTAALIVVAGPCLASPGDPVGTFEGSTSSRHPGAPGVLAVPSRSHHPTPNTQHPAPAELSFPNDILPVLSKAGCNAGACHAKQGGKNGFQLSVFAFDPAADYEAIVRQAHGRRIDRLDPGRSLLLLKATL